MNIRSFRDLIVWQKSSDFSVEIYKIFSNSKDYGFRDQIQRASLSISNNIAEGYARQSDKAFKNYLMIAKSSATEVESMLIIAGRLSYISQNQLKILNDRIDEIHKLI